MLKVGNLELHIYRAAHGRPFHRFVVCSVSNGTNKAKEICSVSVAEQQTKEENSVPFQYLFRLCTNFTVSLYSVCSVSNGTTNGTVSYSVAETEQATEQGYSVSVSTV